MRGIFVFALLLLSSICNAATNGLVIHTAEIGVGKFHRQDNKEHVYSAGHAWAPYILANNVTSLQTISQKNADGSYTIFFASLDDMLKSAIKISQTENKKISVLNVHGHGLPGAMWFPKDNKTLNSYSCYQWKDAATGGDAANYDQYYSPISASDIQQIKDMAEQTSLSYPCTTGLKEWQEIVAQNQAFKSLFADDAQLHFVSCVVGLGTQGKKFTEGMAALLLNSQGKGQAQTSIDFGLGDWSMPGGMGFWDYQNDSQLSHDNNVYPQNRRDSEIAQKGTIRVVSQAGGSWQSKLFAQRDLMSLGEGAVTKGNEVAEPIRAQTLQLGSLRVRIPGTNVYLDSLPE